MAHFSKNEILELNKDQTMMNEKFIKGQKFVVTKCSKESVSIYPLKDNGTLSEKGYAVDTIGIVRVFNTTNTTYNPPKLKNTTKKGMIFEFSKNFSDGDIVYPKGTRVIIVKGGNKPEFFTNFTQPKKGLSHISGYQVCQNFINDFFTPAEPIVCELTKDFSYKGLKEGQGEETRNFYCEICFKKKVIGSASNDGQGGSHRINIYKSPEWDVLLDEAFKILQELQVNEKESYKIVKKHDVDEIVIDYLCGNYVGLIDLKAYLSDYVK